MDYSDVISHIMGRRRFGNRPGVEISGELLDKLNHPEQGLRIIHVAGTNGKGSVANIIARTLSMAGYRTGLFTSPHLIDYRERIQIDGEEISGEEVISLYEQIDALGGSPTMFDISFIMAMLYFKNSGCDYCVIETGLGGRLDSTNAIKNEDKICVITSIGLDHTGQLGETLTEIAGEKAGIIWQKNRVVIGTMAEEARAVITDHCRKVGAGTVVYAGVPEEETFFKKNYMTAACALEMLGISKEAFAKYYGDGRDYRVMGRMQTIGDEKKLIVDGAHNPQAMEELIKVLKEKDPKKKFTFITGGLSGHDIHGVLKKMVPHAKRIYAVGIDDERALSAQEVSEAAKSLGADVKAIGSVQEAVKLALDENGSDDPVVACGSFYLAGEILDGFSFKA